MRIYLLLIIFVGTLNISNALASDLFKPELSFKKFQALDPVPTVDPTPSNCAKPCQDRRQEFRYVVYVGKQIYCYWDLKRADTQLDFDALAKKLENSITDGLSSSSYYKILREWASSFHDGHVNVMPDVDLSGLEIYTAPIRVEVFAPATDHEKVIVTTTTAGVGVAVGDEITAINDVPVKDALTAAAATSSSGSTERMRRFSAGRRLVDVLGMENGSAPFVVTVNPFSGDAAKKVAIYRNIEIDLKPVAAPVVDDTGVKYITAEILPNSIGYLRLDAFQGSQDEYLIGEAMDRLAGTNGLIIDLRKNGGGDLSGDRIIERLITASVTRYKRSERLGDFLFSIQPELFGLAPDSTGQFALWHDLTVAPKTDLHYGKPVVVLISPYCFSACDTFSAALKGNKLATFVGEPTGGGTGTPLVFALPLSPYKFRYSVIRGQTPAGDTIETVGTSPDILVEPTVVDRVNSKDSQLEKALAVIQNQIGAPVTLPSALSSVPQVWKQSLDIAPTREENEYLLGIAGHDER